MSNNISKLIKYLRKQDWRLKLDPKNELIKEYIRDKKMDPRKWIEIQESGSTKMNLKEPYRALTKFALLPPSQFWQAPQPGNR